MPNKKLDAQQEVKMVNARLDAEHEPLSTKQYQFNHFHAAIAVEYTIFNSTTMELLASTICYFLLSSAATSQATSWIY
jgi:hypothetical protein